MSTSSRQSNAGPIIRRRLQKPYIPFRGDSVEVGRKTGIKIMRVERGPDGFESFEEILRHADNLSPPRLQGEKLLSTRVLEAELYEDEILMGIENSKPYVPNHVSCLSSIQEKALGPLHHLANTHQPAASADARSSSPSSKSSLHTPEIDFSRVSYPQLSDTSMAHPGFASSLRPFSPLPHSTAPSLFPNV